MRGERGAGVESRRDGPREAVGAEDRPGVVLRAVDSVGIAGDRPDARRTVEPDGERQQIFGVAPAPSETRARQRDRGLPAGEQRDRPARATRDFEGEPGVRGAERGGLPGEIVAEDRGRELLPFGGPRGGGERIAGARRRSGTARWRASSASPRRDPRERSLSTVPPRFRSAPGSPAHRPRSVGSATVGPDATVAGSSPGTSEMASVATRAGAAAAARRPPLIADRCWRTQLISSIAAPQASSERVSACFSARRMPGAGLASKAEPPPEARQTRRSSAPRPEASARARSAAATAASSGTGWPASTISTARHGAPWP